MPDRSRNETIAAAVAGSKEALEMILLWHAPRVRVMIAGRLHGVADRLEVAEDAAQEVLLDVAQDIARLDPPTSAQLKCALANRVDEKVAELRARTDERDAGSSSDLRAAPEPVDLQWASDLLPVWRSISRDGRTPDSMTERREALTILLEELDELGREQREAVIGSIFDHIPTRELAQRFGEKRTAVAMRIARGLETLARRVRNRMKTPFVPRPL